MQLENHALVSRFELRFRFDKSKHNFTIRKYGRTSHPIFCPVDAALSIFHRANTLNVPFNEPVGVIGSSGSTTSPGYRFMKDRDITTVMRKACLHAYPDPNSYMHLHINRIVPHSNRVTAAVCLKQGGAQNDEIAYRLWWHTDSVPTYL